MGQDTIQDVVDRIERYADRERNAGDPDGEQAAREAAAEAQSAGTLEEALQIEAELYQSANQLIKKKKNWFQRLFGGGDDDDNNDSFSDNS